MNTISNQTFTDFIQHIGAQRGDDLHITFPLNNHAETQTETVLTVLGHYSLLCFTGANSGKFLQGQTTCNIKDISAEKSLPGGCCSPKGRMYCNFQMAMDTQAQYWLRLRRDIADSSLQTLNKYLALFRGSKAINCADTHIVLGISGNNAPKIITELLGDCPQQRNNCVATDTMLAICIEAASRFELWLPIDQALTLWPTLIAQCQTQNSDTWRLANIRAGLGDVHPQTHDEFVPQMLNLQALDGISFTKGCYTGQEIVARMHYLGKLKKRLYRASCSGLQSAPLVGSELMAINELSGNLQAIGQVVESQMSDDQHCELLAVIANEIVDSGKAIQLGENAAEITVLPLPYAITTAQSSKP
jgi:folate-binding protein YgfZ